MPPWVKRDIIEINLDQSAAQRYQQLPQDAITEARALLDSVLEQVPAYLRYLADMVRVRTGNRFHAEATAIAARAEVDWRSVILANVSYDLTMAVFGCSTMALATAKGPVLARNMDWWPEDLLARATYQFDYLHHNAPGFITAGWPGSIGVVTGMSARGFAVALNAVVGPEGMDKTGYPVLLHLRRVLEDADDYESALRMLSDTKLAAPALVTLIGVDNSQRVVIERSPRRHALRHPDGPDQPLIATNDYRTLFKPQTHEGSEIYQTTCGRFANLTSLSKKLAAIDTLDDAALLYILSDPGVLAGITAQQIIMRPSLQQMNTYVPRRLLSA